ncbi:hypothetical protein ACFL3S_07735 [Gemmatimonadota bacterium]
MRKCAGLFVALLAFLAFSPIHVSAQSLYFGGGATIPTSDYGDYADTGLMAVAGIDFPVGPEGLSVFGEGFFGQNGHSDIDGDKTLPFGAMGGLLLNLAPGADAGVYVFGQAGIMVHKYSSDEYDGDSESAFGYGGGAGYGFPLGGIDAWVEGRYMSASFDSELGGSATTAFIGIMAGISIDIGP